MMKVKLGNCPETFGIGLYHWGDILSFSSQKFKTMHTKRERETETDAGGGEEER